MKATKIIKYGITFIGLIELRRLCFSVGETKGEIDFIEVRIYNRTIFDVFRNMNKIYNKFLIKQCIAI